MGVTTCGEFDGRTKAGKHCRRPAGWGRDTNRGRCRAHIGQKLEPIDGGPNACLNCPPIPTRAPMQKLIAVGFGIAQLTRDGEAVYTEPVGIDDRECWTFADAEALAVQDPECDWRVELYGPLQGETYQRHGAQEWNLVERNQGFA